MSKELTINQQALNQLIAINRLLSSRAQMGAFINGDKDNRDYDTIFHYPKTEDLNAYDHFMPMFLREPLAARVVEFEPDESWKVLPNIFEREEGVIDTDFEHAWNELTSSLTATAGEPNFHKPTKGNALMACMKHADTLSGIGRYGGIFLAFNDGKELTEPVERSGDLKLMYCRSLDEVSLTIAELVRDKNSPRNGQPQFYNMRQYQFDQSAGGNNVIAGNDYTETKVHWTRVVHITKGDGVFHLPRMEQVYNVLLGSRRIYGSDPEMFYLGAYGGVSVESHPQLAGEAKFDMEDLTDQFEQMFSGLQRWIAFNGASAKSLAPTISDPSPHLMILIEAICIQKGWPKRIFLGSERGELASSQDSEQHDERMARRQEEYITPDVIVPVVNRLIAVGVLPQPEEFCVTWPDLTKINEAQRAETAFKKAQALAAYVQNDLHLLMSEEDYLIQVVGFDKATAEQVLSNVPDFVPPEDDDSTNPLDDIEGEEDADN